MRLGIDITSLQHASSGGIGVATHETIRALAQQSDIEVVLYGRSAPLVPFSEAPLDLGLELRLGSGPVSRAGNIAWLQYGVGPMLTRDRIDVFWGTRHVLPRNAKRVALVATLYDFWYERFPQQMPLANRTLNHAVMRDLMRDGDVLTAISDAVADDARSLYPKSAEKVRTVLLGLNPSGYSPAGEAAVMAVRDRLGVNGPFVLALDVHNPRKNFSAVLDAVALMPRGGVEIVAGGTSRAAARDQSIEHHAEQLGLSDRVRFVGDVSHADLLALYSGCGVFVYPSVYEGFGMPVLEAMACGAPVICSDTSSLPQVVGEAALMVDPTSAEQLSAALVSVLGEPLEAQRLRDLGLIRAREFTWARTAAGMRAAFEAAIAAHQS